MKTKNTINEDFELTSKEVSFVTKKCINCEAVRNIKDIGRYLEKNGYTLIQKSANQIIFNLKSNKSFYGILNLKNNQLSSQAQHFSN